MNQAVSTLKTQKEKLFKIWAEQNKIKNKVRYIMHEHTKFVDWVTKETVKAFYPPENWCIVALGSYGRRQMNPHSDVDIMIVTTDTNEMLADISREIYDIFYALDYEISIVTRTVDECIKLSSRDDIIKTSLFDHRLVYGNRKLYENYTDSIQSGVIHRDIYEFVSRKVENLKTRHSHFGNTVFVLEPNVKEGVGGIRDYHTLLWLGKAWFSTKNILDMRNKGFISEEDYSKLRNALYFLWQLRNALHLISGKKNDVLYIDHRPTVADMLGLPKTDTKFNDRLMRKYYYYASNLHRISEKYIDMFNHREPLNVTPKTFFISDKILLRENHVSLVFQENISLTDIFELFYYSSLYNKTPDEHILEHTQHIIKREVWKERNSRFINFMFKSLLSLKSSISTQIRKMHESAVLDKFIPEFGNTYCLTEASLYHKYTVDEHSIQALEHIDKLFTIEEGSNFILRLKEILTTLEAHDILILRLSILLHDIGKVKQGKHTDIGANLCLPIAERMGLGKDLSEKLIFLVRNHLVINKIISKNDVYSPTVIKRFAELVKDVETLNLLVLLTYADMNAVNDNVWTNWKEDLVDDLYTNTIRFFEYKNYNAYISTQAEQSKKRLLEELGADYMQLILSLPPAILTDENREHLERFIKHLLCKHSFVKTYKTGSNLLKVFVYYRDEFGFFNKISGILTCLDGNILRGKSYALANGMIIDVFTVSGTEDIDETRINNMLRDIHNNKANLDNCVENKRKKFLNRFQRAKLTMSLDRIRVKVNNSQSDVYTVIRVYAPDRVGLLYDITKVFSSFNLMVGMFILDTKGEVAVDTFYICTRSGKKIFSSTLLDLIKNKILEVIYR